MQQKLAVFADEYDTNVDMLIDDADGQLSMNNPLVFVFIGDKSLDALNAVYEINQKKWHNSKGVLYVHFYTERTVNRDNVFSLKVASSASERQTVRRDLHRQFHRDDQLLVDLNRTVRQVSNRIAEFGRVYASFQRLNIAVVTRVDDPCTVLLQELVLLTKSVLGESFKLVQMDLYGLMKEKQGEEEFAYASSLGISFLRELDRYQRRDYTFSGMLQVTEDRIKLPVEHTASPLFDLVYLLSDKNEHAMFPEGGAEDNFDIICHMNVLKNRKVVDEHDHRHDAYNNQHFRQHMSPVEAKGGVYATAGFSKMKRPNQAIALTVLAHFYQNFLDKLKEGSQAERRTIIDLLQLDRASLERKLSGFVPERDRLEEMGGLLSDYTSLDELKRLTLDQAEQTMYGRHAADFFREHFIVRTEAALTQLDVEGELAELLDRRVTHNPAHGVYSAYAWTSEREDAGVYQELHTMAKETAKQLDEARAQLAQFGQETVESQSFPRIPFMNKGNMKKFSRHFFDKIYGKKLDILALEMKLLLLKRYEQALEKLHLALKSKVDRLHELEKQLKEAYRQSVSEARDYLGRNIPEYYGTVVADIVQDIAAKRGDRFYCEERYIGNVAQVLDAGMEALLDRLIEVCRKEIFTYPQFRQSFETELLHRANVTVKYDDKDHVLSKEELYRDLYVKLEEQAAVHIDVYNYTHKHRYDEKYFFANFESEFIRYAFEADKGSRVYKLGCVHELRNSGVEKLNIMGGFQLEDMMYVRNGSKYYESYRANGFQFHAEDVE